MAKISVMTEKLYTERMASRPRVCFGYYDEPPPKFIKANELVEILNSAGQILEDREYVLLDE